MSVNEWPEPTRLACARAPATSSASSSSRARAARFARVRSAARAPSWSRSRARAHRGAGRLGGRALRGRGSILSGSGGPVGLGVGRGVAQVGLGVERRHAARARGGDRLAVGVVHEVAGGEHARAGWCAWSGPRPGRSRSRRSRPGPATSSRVGPVADGDERARRSRARAPSPSSVFSSTALVQRAVVARLEALDHVRA